jgi:hypothetical protein
MELDGVTKLLEEDAARDINLARRSPLHTCSICFANRRIRINLGNDV